MFSKVIKVRVREVESSNLSTPTEEHNRAHGYPMIKTMRPSVLIMDLKGALQTAHFVHLGE